MRGLHLTRGYGDRALNWSVPAVDRSNRAILAELAAAHQVRGNWGQASLSRPLRPHARRAGAPRSSARPHGQSARTGRPRNGPRPLARSGGTFPRRRSPCLRPRRSKLFKELNGRHNLETRVASAEVRSLGSVALHQVVQVAFVPAHEVTGMASDCHVGVDFVVRVAWERESRRRFRQYFGACLKPREELSPVVFAKPKLRANLISIENFTDFSFVSSGGPASRRGGRGSGAPRGAGTLRHPCSQAWTALRDTPRRRPISFRVTCFWLRSFRVTSRRFPRSVTWLESVLSSAVAPAWVPGATPEKSLELVSPCGISQGSTTLQGEPARHRGANRTRRRQEDRTEFLGLFDSGPTGRGRRFGSTPSEL